LIKDYEELVEALEDILPEVQEEVDLEAVCAVFEELMENEPIAVLRALWRCELVENAEDVVIEQEAVKQSHVNAEELVGYCTIRTVNRKLSRNKKVYSTKKKFECANCSKSFIQKAHLDRHSRVHTGEKPFQCAICDKRFSQKINLNSHTRIHSGEKPFESSICGKGFSQKPHLNDHTRVHTREKPFECTFCSKKFKHKSSLNKHVMVHT